MEHASVEASRASIPKQVARYARVAGSAKRLVDAIDSVIESDDLFLIAFQMARADGSMLGHGHFSQKVMEHRDFLNHLKAAVECLQDRMKKGRGQPRNTVSYVVLLDIAAIFRWLSGLEANREVDRMTGDEKGAFYNFAAALWPPVFASGLDGLRAAMKNWSSGYRKYSEASAIIANIDLRYPSWRVFAR
jgi:hypothetical protein